MSRNNGAPAKYIPQIIEPRCRVCRSKYRDLIDRMLVSGYSYASIERGISEIEKISAKSIERHAKRHLDYENTALREIIEDKARISGLFVEDHKQRLVTADAVISKMIEKGWDQLLKEEAWIKFGDVIEAMKLKKQLEEDSASLMVEKLMDQLAAIRQAIEELVDESLYQRLLSRAREIYSGQTHPMIEGTTIKD